MSDEEKKNVSIRGVEKEAYESLVKLAKDTGKTLGELASEAFKLYVILAETSLDMLSKFLKMTSRAAEEVRRLAQVEIPTVIRNISEVELSHGDLSMFTKPIIIMNSDRLVLGDDVTVEDVKRKIKTILNVKVVEIPEHIPKVILLEKSRFVEKIVVRRKSGS